jgi:hypothetical protein
VQDKRTLMTTLRMAGVLMLRAVWSHSIFGAMSSFMLEDSTSLHQCEKHKTHHKRQLGELPVVGQLL